MVEIVMFVDLPELEAQCKALFSNLDKDEFLFTYSQTTEGAGYLSANVVIIAMTARTSYHFIAKIQAAFSSQTTFVVVVPPDDVDEVTPFQPDYVFSSANLPQLIDIVRSAGNSAGPNVPA